MRITLPGPLGRSWARAVLVVLVPLVIAGLALLVVPLVTGLPGNAAFRVGDTVVTKDQLHDRVEVLSALYGIREPVGGSELEQFRRDIAKAVAVSMILDNAAAERKIVIADKSVRDTLSKMIDEQMGSDGQRAFTDLLAKLKVSENDVLDEVGRQQRTARLFQEVTAPAVATVADDQLPSYYEGHRADFAVPAQRHLRNIVVATREEADQAVQRTRDGADFAALAGETSLDESTRSSQGDLGFVTASQLDAEYAKAAFAAPVGSVFGPVQTRYGWNVGQVLEDRPASQPSFEQARDEVREALRSERAVATWRTWLADRIRAADVEYADDYRPADPDAPPSDDSATLPQPGVTGSPAPAAPLSSSLLSLPPASAPPSLSAPPPLSLSSTR
ncbi:peptidylprolyl isomerase [Protofrankia coriariae]|uniref:Peptidylprolyl isomerase n=1 Tax=Protofrankia coriariae TaxID=1562887 RepID=A0ABR5F395_9ACTN|nr:peptidyl-prolyl cis-trans isomerase [Protofrankia coriariae]KLL11183.1 peptidylprolyl isomerase [Protofrankia coriariae]